MAGSRRVTIEFLGSDKSASKVARGVDKSTSKLGDTFKRVGKAAALGLGVGIAAAAAGLVAFGKGAVEEAREAQKIGAQTEAVIKSTGGAANVTADQVAGLAEALSMKAGIDDEVIQSGANMLLTFRNIRNEVGKGNDMFDQATAVALDMSVAMGSDMKSASILVGKALNDPIKGLSALSRVGVSFTEQQQKNIESLVEQGKTMSAQKIIMKELNTQFEGSAAAQATAGDRAKVAWGNFQEFIGAKLLPIIDKLAVWFTVVLVPALQRFSVWFEREGMPKVRQFADFLAAAWAKIAAWTRKHWPEISKTIKDVVTNIVAIIRGVVKLLKTIWDKWGEDFLRIAKVALKFVIGTIRNAMKVIRGVIDVVTGLIKGDWSQVWKGIKQIFGGIWDQIKTQLRAVMQVIREVIRNGWDAVKDITKGMFGSVKDLARNGFNALVDLARGAVGRVADVFSSLGGKVRDVFGGIMDFIRGVPGKIRDVFSNIWSGITGGLRDAVNSALGLPLVFPGWDWPGPGGIGEKTLIPALAGGGLVKARPGGTLALLAEAGEDEIVAPLSKVRGLSGGGGVTIVINGALDPNAVAKQVQTMLLKLKRNNGMQLGLA